jgi:uncharacterized membrane protein YphA (DoxX/SURF4 family)
MFVFGGLDALRNPESKVERAETVTQDLADRFPMIPRDTVTLIKLNGMAQVVAGALLAVGKFRRLAAAVLIGSIIPTTYAGHRFWKEPDDAVRAQQQVHFLKNLGLLGGLILAAFDTEGAPSLGWRARRGTRRMRNTVALGRASSKSRTYRFGEGRKARRRAHKVALTASRRANNAVVAAARQANVAASDAARAGVDLVAPYVVHANQSALGAAKKAVEVAGPHLTAAVEQAGDVLPRLTDQLDMS